MRIQRGLAGGTTVALLLALGATASSAQSINTESNTSRPSVTRPEIRAIPFQNSFASSADSPALTSGAPLPPPRQISHRKAIVLGMVIGGAVGATAGYFIAHDSCNSCDDSGPVVLVSSLGALGGAALGGFVAARNSPSDMSPSSLRAAQAKFLGLPHPVVQYKLAAFR